ncbi:MAG: AAA family ATPase [Tannerella sp.]|jgi:hypothetical protein|nr:AAA family ATPase [Tannerella sp.]
MKTELLKCQPYGNSDFRDIMTQNYIYIDKTRFIEESENRRKKSGHESENGLRLSAASYP